MRVDELKPSQAKELSKGQFTPTEIRDKLRSYGYNRGPEGMYSEVWINPDTNIVVKVSVEGDDCFAKFCDLVQANRGNPHLPRIAHYQTVKTSDGKKYFLAYIEKLSVIKHASVYRYAAAWCEDAIDMLNEDITIDELHKRLDARNLPESENDKIHDVITHKLLDTLELMASKMPKSCNNDLHWGNVMLRGDTMVITDPWALDEDA